MLVVYSLLVNFFFSIKSFLIKRKKGKKNLGQTEVTVTSKLSAVYFILVLIPIVFSSQFNIANVHLLFKFNGYEQSAVIALITYFFVVCVDFLFRNYYTQPKNLINYNMYIGLLFFPLVYCATLSTNFIVFFLFIELFGYLFYLQFLQFFTKNNNKTAHYFDNLLLYFWVNFFGSVIFVVFIIFVFFKFTTVDFISLTGYSKNLQNIFYIFLLGFSLKIGMPGFHFFKMELYKNLKLDAIVNFSFFSIFGYLILLNFIIIKLNIFIVYSFGFFISFVLFIILFTPAALKITNIVFFFGCSAVLNAIMLVTLII